LSTTTLGRFLSIRAPHLNCPDLSASSRHLIVCDGLGQREKSRPATGEVANPTNSKETKVPKPPPEKVMPVIWMRRGPFLAVAGRIIGLILLDWGRN
jgi:hypothetical protein